MTLTTNLTGKFLIALPGMGDPRFKQAVIYVCFHDQSGAMGIMINKQNGPFMLSNMLKNVGIEGQVTVADTPVLKGGPVDWDRGFVLHSPDYVGDENSLEISDTLRLTWSHDILEALVSDAGPERAILSVGYSGWDEGQLEHELQENAWLTVEADEALIFDAEMDTKWDRAIRKLGITPDRLAHTGGRA
ncbi:MAG: YqgE/AlgH family protein [Alphaproteobacteria bacterium]